MRYLSLLFLLCRFAAEAYSIVFVHIGPEIPNYLSVAVQQARLFNKECPIYVIGNEKARCPIQFDGRTQFVSCESLTKSCDHRKFISLSPLDRRSMGGFWAFASERFFYLEELVQKYQLTDVFHLENDVMLYADLARLLSIFHEKYAGRIGATFDSDARCIPGFMYIADPKPLSQLTQWMAFRAYTGKNDMQILQEFKEFYHAVYIEHLPIVMPQYALDYGLKNALNEKARQPGLYSQYFEQFASIFDAAAIGQYLGGVSPRNGRAVPGFINETCLFNPSRFGFTWEADSEGRWIPYICYKESKYPINNLHIHCKNLKPFFSRR